MEEIKKIQQRPVKAVPNFPKDWSLEDLKFLYAAREDGISYSSIATCIKKSVSSIKRVYRTVVWDKTDFYDPATKRMKDAIKREFLEKMLDAQERKENTDKIRTELIIDRLAQSIKPYPKAPSIYIQNPENRVKKYKPEDVGLVLSDLHVGHAHTLQETNGLSEYSFDIFKKRLNNLKFISKEIVELHSKLYKVPTLHIMCLGDVVDGMNDAGSWSSTYISMPIYHQALKGAELIAEAIYYWLGLFEEIRFYGVMGNHGRGAKAGSEKHFVNWDLVCYKFLEMRFKDNPRVKFNIPEGWFVFEKIRNHNFLLLHGDDLSGKGLPLDKLAQAEANMIGILKQIPDYTIAGHYHNAGELTTNHGKIILNGSFVGGDVYSLKTLQRGARPVQKIFGIHETHGITWTYDIRLDVDKKE